MSKRKSAAAKLAAGNPGKRKLKSEPEPEPIQTLPDPPEWFDETAAEYWRRVGPELHARGLLTVVDLPEFERLCCSFSVWMRFAEAVRDEQDLNHKKFHEFRRAGEALNKSAGQFGLTPSSRSGLAISAPSAKNSAMAAHLKAAREIKANGAGRRESG